MPIESKFLHDAELSVILTRMEEVKNLLGVLRKVRDMTIWRNMAIIVSDLQHIYKAILSTTRVYMKRMGIDVKVTDNITDPPQKIWIRELDVIMQNIFIKYGNPDPNFTRIKLAENNIRVADMLNDICFLFDVPRFDMTTNEMKYAVVNDPGDMRHVFQENEVFIEQLELVLHILCGQIEEEKKVLLGNLIRKYEILLVGLTESINQFIAEKLALHNTGKGNFIEKEINMERLLCQLRLSSGNQ